LLAITLTFFNKKYEEMAEKDKKRYEDEKKAYEAIHTAEE
jgi:hypothetical protein